MRKVGRTGPFNSAPASYKWGSWRDVEAGEGRATTRHTRAPSLTRSLAHSPTHSPATQSREWPGEALAAPHCIQFVMGSFVELG